MSEFTRWLSIENLYRPRTEEEIFQLKEVVCTEKIHGTNAQMGVVDGEFISGSRNRYVDMLNPSDHMGFVNYTLTKKDAICSAYGIDKDFLIYGEWYGRGIGKGIDYGEAKQFRAFAIKWGESLVPFDLLIELCGILDILPPIVVYRGAPNMEIFNAIKGQESEVGKLHGVENEENTAEGIVIASPHMLRTHFGEYIIAKHKDSKWEERASKSKKDAKEAYVVPEDFNSFVEEFVTEMRLEHVKDSVRADGFDAEDPKNTGQILKGMCADIHKEGREEIISLGEKLGGDCDLKRLNKLILEATKKLLFKR